jgi:hypothetical protein
MLTGVHNDVELTFYGEATSVELVRRDANWDVWFVGCSPFVATFDAIGDDAVAGAINGHATDDRIICYVESRLAAAGYHVSGRKKVPGTVAAWVLAGPGQ